MAAPDSSAYSDSQYFAQLRQQAEGALSKTERRACSLVAQVLQAHALLGATVGLPLKVGQQKQQLANSIGKIEKQVTALKGEVSVMLQDIVVAEAAIVNLKMAVESGEEDPTSASLTTPTMVTKEATHSAVTSLVQLLSGESPSGVPSNDEQWDDSFNVEEMEAASKDESTVETVVPSGSFVEGIPIKSSKGQGRRKLPPITCKICRIQFKYRAPLFKHFRDHPEQNINASNFHHFIECSDPGTVSALTHAISGHEEGSPSAGAQDRKINFKTLMNVRKEGQAEKKFTCVVCNKHFNRANKLVRHMQIHDPERPRVECKHCNRSFTRYDTMYYHMRTQHPDTREGEGEPSLEASKDESPRRRVEGGTMAYRCSGCSNTYSLLTAFKAHDCAGASKDPDPMVRCIHCNHAFATYDQLATHQVNAHQFSCDMCSKTFLHEAYLNVHKVIHSGPGRFTCQECQLSMEELEEYQEHIKTHPKYSPYKCVGCGKAFSFPSLIVAHQQSCSAAKACNASSVVEAPPTDLTFSAIASEGGFSDAEKVTEAISRETANAIPPPLSFSTPSDAL